MSPSAIERGGEPSWIDRLDQSAAARAKNFEFGRKAQSRLQSTTPEIPRSDLSSFISSERGSTRLILPVTLSTLAALAGAGYLFFAQDRGSSTAPRENIPASDTINPPQLPDNSSVSAPAGGKSPDNPPPPDQKKVEPFNCGILSPEACATGEYIQWNRFDGQKLRGIGFILSPGEDVKMPKALQVSKTVINQPNTYRGVLLV